MCYTNILQILELSQIPLHSCDRAENDPIVIGGGPCVYNPEPLAEFFDLFYIGEGETVYDELLDTYKNVGQREVREQSFLNRRPASKESMCRHFMMPNTTRGWYTSIIYTE